MFLHFIKRNFQQNTLISNSDTNKFSNLHIHLLVLTNSSRRAKTFDQFFRSIPNSNTLFGCKMFFFSWNNHLRSLLHYFSIISFFQKHLNNATGVMFTTRRWGSFHCSRNPINSKDTRVQPKKVRFYQSQGRHVSERIVEHWTEPANKCNMRQQHLFIGLMNRASLKHNYKFHKCFVIVHVMKRGNSLITDGSFVIASLKFTLHRLILSQFSLTTHKIWFLDPSTCIILCILRTLYFFYYRL